MVHASLAQLFEEGQRCGQKGPPEPVIEESGSSNKYFPVGYLFSLFLSSFLIHTLTQEDKILSDSWSYSHLHLHLLEELMLNNAL